VRPPGATRALVQTIDVLTPMVDDPRMFGAIAAVNAMSDVWAMGGAPEVALAFVGFPTDVLPLEALREVIAGLRDATVEAGCAIVGGHTIIDPEPKAGLAVTGSVDPAAPWTHRAASPGHAIILTKAIGTGVAVNAMKKLACPDEVQRAAVASMRRLNRAAAMAGLAHGAVAATDVTGFGLLGHLRNVLDTSGVTARIQAAAVPILPGVRALAEAGMIPGGTKKNLAYAAPATSFADDVPEVLRLLLADAQTSGGLLLFVPEGEAEALVRRLVDEGHAAARIGDVVERGDFAIRVE
jgi:selenide,water dikinase